MNASPFARLHPMPRDFEATVSIAQLWEGAFKYLEETPSRDEVVRKWTGYDPVQFSEERQRELWDITVSVLLQTAIKDNKLEVFVSDGQRFFKLPAEAMVAPFDSVINDGDPTFLARHSVGLSFCTGLLSYLDAPDQYRWIADDRLPLLITRRGYSDVVGWAKEVIRPEDVIEVPGYPTAQACIAWVAEQVADPRWPFATLVFWVAERNLRSSAIQFLHWAGTELDPMRQGSGQLLRWVLSMGELEPLVEPRPIAAIERALRNGALVARGYFEGVGSRLRIDQEQWDGLELSDAPAPFTNVACALKRGRIKGGRLEGFWTDLRFDLDKIIEAFPPPGAARDLAMALRSPDIDGSTGSEEWRVRPGERLNMWVFRPAVVEEAERRLSDRLTKKTSINGVLWEMAGACKMPWSQGSIASTRRRGC